MFSKRNIQISIGLIVMGLALLTLFLDYRDVSDILRPVQALQATATAALLFGILKCHSAHKANFLLFWLGATSIFFTMLIYASLYYLNSYYMYHYTEVTLLLSAAAGVGYMMTIIYKDYVELTQGTVEPIDVKQTIQNSAEPVKDKQPPPYDSSLQNLSVVMNV